MIARDKQLAARQQYGYVSPRLRSILRAMVRDDLKQGKDRPYRPRKGCSPSPYHVVLWETITQLHRASLDENLDTSLGGNRNVPEPSDKGAGPQTEATTQPPPAASQPSVHHPTPTQAHLPQTMAQSAEPLSGRHHNPGGGGMNNSHPLMRTGRWRTPQEVGVYCEEQWGAHFGAHALAAMLGRRIATAPNFLRPQLVRWAH